VVCHDPHVGKNKFLLKTAAPKPEGGVTK